jgi:hypothetical protein
MDIALGLDITNLGRETSFFAYDVIKITIYFAS